MYRSMRSASSKGIVEGAGRTGDREGGGGVQPHSLSTYRDGGGIRPPPLSPGGGVLPASHEGGNP